MQLVNSLPKKNKNKKTKLSTEGLDSNIPAFHFSFRLRGLKICIWYIKIVTYWLNFSLEPLSAYVNKLDLTDNN